MTEVLMSLWRGEIRVPPRRPTMRQIAHEVADENGLTFDELRSATRLRPVAHVRQFAMWRCMKETHNSSTSVGLFFGGRDHSTVLYAVKAVERRRLSA